MSAIREDRDAILEQLSASEQGAGHLISGLSAFQVNWRPNDGASWSICQCVDHLARTNRIYCQAMLETMARARHQSSATVAATPGWFARMFIGKMEPPVRTRFKTLKGMIPPTDGDAQVALREFVNSHQEARRLIASWDQTDLNRIRFKSPFAPLIRFTVATGLLIINAHDRRHLWQAEQVKAADGFPVA